jgi:hypothetical protein
LLLTKKSEFFSRGCKSNPGKIDMQLKSYMKGFSKGRLAEEAGLPDGFFFNQKFQILESRRWENVDIFYGHSEYFMDTYLGYFVTIWYILC